MALHLAIVNPKKDPAFKGAVLPYKPPVDKIVAFYFLQSTNQVPVEGLQYWTQNECPPEQFSSWRDQGFCPIDIGDRKYHDSGVGSATEFVAKEFGIELTPGLAKLLEIVNKNNKNGELKDRQWSVARMLRDFYELTDDDDAHVVVLMETLAVIQAFARVEDGEVHQSVEGLDEALPHLVEQFAKCNYAPFTLARYMRDLWTLGATPAEIADSIAYWTGNQTKVDARKEAAVAAFARMTTKDWFLAGGVKGILLRTDDRFLTSAVDKDYRIRIVINSSGHTTIMARGLDLTAMKEELQKLEDGRWYHQAKMGVLINGGPQYRGVAPTRLKSHRLVGLLQDTLKKKKG